MGKTNKSSFKDSVENFRQLAATIKRREYSPVYLLMGEEPYFIDCLSDLLAESILTDAERSFNQTVVYGKDGDSAMIVNQCKQMPMMGGHNVVIVKEAQALKKIELLLSYTQKPAASTILVICHKEKGLDKRSVLYKSIADKGMVFESTPARDYEIGGWLSDFVKSKGLIFDDVALNMLTDHLGTDLSKISNELGKMVTSLPEGTKQITADHVEQNIGISKEFNNFELTRAITDRNLKKALLIADHFGRNPKDNPFVVTITMIFSHFQKVFLLNYQKWLSRKNGTAMPSDMELAKVMKLSSPFLVKEYQKAANNYPNQKVFAIFALLREFDMKSKGVNVGSEDDGELLRELLMKIMF